MSEEVRQRSLSDAVLDLVVFLLKSFAVGFGIGFVQGLIAFRELWHGGGLYGVLGMSLFAAFFGAGIASLVGAVVYVVLGHRQSNAAFPYVARTSFLVGIATAYVLGFTYFGWVSGWVTPIAAIVAAIRFRTNPRIEKKSSPGNWLKAKPRQWLKRFPLAIILLSGILSLEYLAARAYRPDSLLYAAEHGNAEAVKTLLADGVDVNAQDGEGGTPIMYAAANGRTLVVELLLSHGAQLNTPTVMDRTPLMWAARNGHSDTVALLLDKGADPTFRDEDGRTALALAKQYNHTTTVELLESRGAHE